MADPLVSIGKGIYVSKPSENPLGVDEASQPTVILIFGWMGAKLPHLLKYTKLYDTIYPSATKLLIRSEPGFFWSLKSARTAYLSPAVEVLEALGSIPPLRNASIEPRTPTIQPRILVHAFSNGGSAQLATLSDILAKRPTPTASSTTPLPPSAVILDSCPGSGGLEAARRAFASPVRNPIMRCITRAFITFFYIYNALVYRLFGKKTMILRIKAIINRHQLLPWLSKRTPRLYLYSKADEVVPWTEVEAHAEEARKAGLEVRMERFEGSPHVAHARTDPGRYWAAVEELWEAATSAPAEIVGQEAL